MPFIKINDGSVHLTSRDALWMDHSNLMSAQRSLLLNSSINGANYSGPPVYTKTPHQGDFCSDGQLPDRHYPSNLLGTIDRSQSPHHYHYAALSNGPSPPAISTFYGGRQHMVR